MNKDHVVGLGIGLLSGAVIGGVIALLYAPQSGKETRQQIKEKTVEVAGAIKEKASGIVDAVKEKTSGAIHAIKS